VRLELLNWGPVLRGQQLRRWADAGAVYFDIAMAESVEGVARLDTQLPPDRLLFGSHFPLFNFEAAQLKMVESGLPAQRRKAIEEDNARRLVARPA
jgi:uncharacterized protein